MRVRRPTRAAALSAAAIVFVAGASMAPATVASAARTGCPKGTEDAVATAYDNVFTRSLGLLTDQRAASLARGDEPAVRSVLDAWLASPVGSSSTMLVNGVRCPTRDRAVVDADLVLAGTHLTEAVPPGRAVRDGTTWKVATSTFCLRMVLENPALADGGVCARNRR